MRIPLGLLTGLAFGLAVCRHANAADAATFPLTGKVTDVDGHPLMGAVVECYQYDLDMRFGSEDPKRLQQTTTDADGVFGFKVPRATLLLIARSPGLAPAWKQFIAKPSADQNLTLTSPTVLAGVVVDEADQPITGAEVYATVLISETTLAGGRRSYSYLTGKLARELFNTRTGADGRFRMKGFPENSSCDLAIQSPGKVLRQSARDHLGPDTLPGQAGEEDLRLVAEPAGSIEGRIVADVPGKSLPAAQLSLRPDGPGFFGLAAPEPVESTADGTFRIPDVAAGSYRLRAFFGTNRIPAWVAEPVPVSVETGQTTRGIELTATHGGLLEVAVVGTDDRQPLADVSVHAFRQSSQTSTTSDDDGMAILRLPPGDYQVAAARPGRIAENTRANVEAGETNRVEIALTPPPTITGVVRRPNGQPAAGLAVRIVGAFSQEDSDTKTDAGGRFKMEWNPRRYGQSDVTFCLLVRDPERNLAVAEEIDEDTTSLELKLAPALTLAGQAECDGRPLTNATAALVFWSGNRGMHLTDMCFGTNVPGHFEIPALPPDRRYGLYVSAPGYGQQYVDAQELDVEPGRVELETVELRPADRKVAGQVVDADDKPVAGAYVNVSGEGQPQGNTRTDREGRFRFDQVCEGRVRLFANARNTYGNIEAEAGDTNVVLRLGDNYSMSPGSATRKLTGVVTDPDGKPVARAQVAVFPEGTSHWVRTDTNGAFKLTFSIQPWQLQSGGDPCLVVRDLVRNLAAAQDVPPDDTNLNVQLTPALTLIGRVENTEGEPLAKAQVGVWLLACNTYSQVSDQLATTDTSGGFEIKTLPSGPQYMIYAMAKDHGRSQRSLDQDTEMNPVELDPFVLKRADQVLAGRVVDENDKPLRGVNVNMSGDDQPQGSDITDSKGRFSFKVCEGTVRLFASSQSGYADASAEAGDTNVVIQLTSRQTFGERTAQRASLKGRQLPDLSSLGVAVDTVPAGKSVLLCLVDVDQRPSRHVVRLLAKRQEALQQQGIALVIVQATVIPPESWQSWKEDNALHCPIGRVEKETTAVRWATDVEALPWLILTDANGEVATEGFPLDELDAKLDELSK